MQAPAHDILGADVVGIIISKARQASGGERWHGVASGGVCREVRLISKAWLHIHDNQVNRWATHRCAAVHVMCTATTHYRMMMHGAGCGLGHPLCDTSQCQAQWRSAMRWCRRCYRVSHACSI
jgi:hypothetical protein